jgi:hypothetical protein
MAYFDLRLPLGWLFLIIGGLLLVAGFVVPPISSDGHPTGININVGWGVVLLFFGAICLFAAWNHARDVAQRQGKLE